MTDSTGSWQPDPHGRHQYRYWDGTQWTDQVADDGVTSVDPPDADAAAPTDAVADAPSDPAVPPAAPVPPADPTTTWGAPSSDPGATTSMPVAGAAPATDAPKSSGNKPALIIGALLLLALLGAGAYLIFGGDDDKDDDASGVTTETTVDDDDADDDSDDDDANGGLGGSISGNDALMDLFIQGVMQGSDLSEDQARCFSEEFFENESLDLEELMEEPDSMGSNPAVLGAFLDIFETCDIDPATLGGTGTGSGITSDGQSYGDDPELDALWDKCEDGDGEACDDLYFNSPFGSEYEEFGDTCGGRRPAGTVFCEFEDLD